MSMLMACDVVSVVRLPSFVRRPDSLSDDVVFVLMWNVYSNTPFHECNGFDAGPHGHPLRSVVVLKNWKVGQGSYPNSRVVAPSFPMLPLSCCSGPCGAYCHPLSLCPLAPFVVRAWPGRIIFCATRGPIVVGSVEGSSVGWIVGRYHLGGGDVGFGSGGGGGGGALAWR